LAKPDDETTLIFSYPKLNKIIVGMFTGRTRNLNPAFAVVNTLVMFVLGSGLFSTVCFLVQSTRKCRQQWLYLRLTSLWRVRKHTAMADTSYSQNEGSVNYAGENQLCGNGRSETSFRLIFLVAFLCR